MIVSEMAKSLEEQVYLELEEAILTGEYKRGESLTEMSLCKRLGVSRTPLRSALQRLCDEGLVDLTPNRGAVVVGISVDDLIDTYKIRIRLEGLVCAMAAQRISDEALTELEATIELCEFYLAKKNLEKLKEMDTHFHAQIYEASGNRTLCKILSALHRNIRVYRRLALTVPKRLESSVEEHKKILGAIKARDAKMADSLMSRHIENAMNNLIIATKSE